MKTLFFTIVTLVSVAFEAFYDTFSNALYNGESCAPSETKFN